MYADKITIYDSKSGRAMIMTHQCFSNYCEDRQYGVLMPKFYDMYLEYMRSLLHRFLPYNHVPRQHVAVRPCQLCPRA